MFTGGTIWILTHGHIVAQNETGGATQVLVHAGFHFGSGFLRHSVKVLASLCQDSEDQHWLQLMPLSGVMWRETVACHVHALGGWPTDSHVAPFWVSFFFPFTPYAAGFVWLSRSGPDVMVITLFCLGSVEAGIHTS